MPLDIIIASLVSAIASLLAGFYSYISSKRKKKIEEENRNKIYHKFLELWNKNYSLQILDKDNIKNELIYFIEPKSYDAKSWRYVLSHLSSGKTENEIENQVKEKIEEIKNRVKDIEKRFPKDSTLEKISSVNDAILATQIEGLTELIRKLEDKILTKWDVAKIVFAIITILGMLVGLVFAIIEYFRT